MEVRNCKKCGRLFNYMGGQPYCPSCMIELEETFKKVKEYIYSNPGAGIQEISEKFELNVSIIHRWIREERLEFSEHSVVGIDCESCGKTIRTGRYCLPCKEKIAHNLASAYATRPDEPKKPVDKSQDRMRYLR